MKSRVGMKIFLKMFVILNIYFASAMSLLGLDDGAGSSTGNGYTANSPRFTSRIMKK
jgi:hypothetical protein